MSDISEIEDELSTPCRWCGGSKVGVTKHWCQTCGGSGFNRTVMWQVGETGMYFFYPLVKKRDHPAPYLKREIYERLYREAR